MVGNQIWWYYMNNLNEPLVASIVEVQESK